MSKELITEKLAYLAALEEKARIQSELPHLYGKKHYKWSKSFFESTKRYNFLVAANQIGKSSVQIRKVIHWATEISLWEKLWPTKPTQFWYLYPTRDVCNVEVNEKWIPLWLPRGMMKDDPKYGWEVDIRQKDVYAIRFKSGVSVYFKTYNQDVSSLQSSSSYGVFCDEELPVELYDEINMRISAADVRGYFHMVFTATLGQQYWKEVLEIKGEKEKFPGALKLNVSMYDCLKYADGSDGPWNLQMIKDVEAACKSQAEIEKRVNGKFTVDTDLKYPEFSVLRNVGEGHKLPSNWNIYAGIDVGSGGETGHPAAICFVAVNREFTQGRVFLGWRGDGVDTTAGDVLSEYLSLRGAMKPVGQYYDWASKDFFTIASRSGEAFQPAEKSHSIGEQYLNTLFKNGALVIYRTAELNKLINELSALKRSTPKTSAKDDFIDALRYAVTKIPWAWDKIVKLGRDAHEVVVEVEAPKTRGRGDVRAPVNLDLLEAEFDEWNSYYEV